MCKHEKNAVAYCSEKYHSGSVDTLNHIMSGAADESLI